MLPTSHRIPIAAADEPSLLEGSLSESFAAFISAASRLEGTHRQLHGEVARLRMELQQRNLALASTLRENEWMRILQKEILHGLPCGVVVLDAESKKVLMLNPEAERLIGVADAGTWESLPDGVRNAIGASSSQMWRDGDEQQVSIQVSGETRWVSVRSTALANSNETMTRATLIVTLRDTTWQKQAEEQREAARNMVALSEIAAVLAHEIRNPLGSLELFASLLSSNGQIRGETKDWVESLQAGIRSLSATVNNVLRFHSSTTVPLVPLNLREAIETAIDFIRPMAKQNRVTIGFEETLRDAEILGEPGSLQQVFLNLGCNALRHTAAGGELKISGELRTADRRIVLEFSDNGSGIKPADLPHVFEPGFSSDAQRTGLGLAVCQRILRQHNAEISVSSEVGSGTTFRMEFPTL